MGEVHCRDPRTGIVYVYSSQSYWDKETKTKKAHRKLIGKLDENGNLVPTKGTPGRNKKQTTDRRPSDSNSSDAVTEMMKSYEQRLKTQADRIANLEATIREITRDKQNLVDNLERILSKHRSV